MTYLILFISACLIFFVVYPRFLRAIERKKMAAMIQDVAHTLVPPLFIQSSSIDDTVNLQYNTFAELLSLAWDKYKQTGNEMDRPLLQLSDLIKPRIRETAFNASAGSALHFFQWKQEETARYEQLVNEFMAKQMNRPFTVAGEQVKYNASPYATKQRDTLNTFEFSINGGPAKN